MAPKTPEPIITRKDIPAYLTVAFDLTGAVKIQQIQYRRVYFTDGVPDDEGQLLPIEFIKAPLENDAITATLEDALDAATAGALLRTAEVEAQLSTLKEEHDRLRVIVDAFPQEDSGGDDMEAGVIAPAIAAEAGMDT